MCIMFSFLVQFVMLRLFPDLMDQIELHGCFIFFAFVTTFAFVFTVFMLEETNGINLDTLIVTTSKDSLVKTNDDDKILTTLVETNEKKLNTPKVTSKLDSIPLVATERQFDKSVEAQETEFNSPTDIEKREFRLPMETTILDAVTAAENMEKTLDMTNDESGQNILDTSIKTRKTERDTMESEA